METNQTLRILHVVGRMACGGTETMIMNLYRNIDRTKVQFDFIVHTNDKCYYDDEIKSLGGKIFQCPRYKGSNHFQYKKWWKNFFINNSGYKIIHGHIGSTASIYLSIAKNYGLKTIAHSHNTTMTLGYKILSYSTRYIADYFFGCSLLAGQYRYGKKLCENKNKFKVFHNAIDTKKYIYNEQIRAEVRKELNIKNEFVIGIVGRFSAQKNPLGTINIFEKIHDIDSTAKFIWCGDGEMRQQVVAHIEKLGLSKSFILLGVRGDVDRILQAMDVFILPSFFEGLPVVSIEAQSAGLPCVFSTGVSTEADLTGNCKFVDLEDKQGWTDAILGYRDFERKADVSKIVEAGYDIKTTAKWLQDFYIKIAEDNRETK